MTHGKSIAAALPALGLLASAAMAYEPLPAGFVFLRDIDPTIRQEIKYASADNFVGRVLPGYDAPECVLKKLVAETLKRVQAELAPQGLSLKVYDCYRPARAVRAMAQWATDGKADGASKRFFPRLQKVALFSLGYIAARSGHSQGNTVDLTLSELSVPASPPPLGASHGSCTSPAAERVPDDGLDMGTGFDCFDPKSHTAASGLTVEQRRARDLLLRVMEKHGFKNYFREWWHFSHGGHGGPALDFPIPRRTDGN